jgi:type I restriction enzyme R subunit
MEEASKGEMDVNYIQSEAVLEHNMIQTLVDMGYERVSIPDEQTLLHNLHQQINLHNAKRLNNTPLSDNEFERLLNELGGKGVFNSAYNLRQLQTVVRDDGTTVHIELLNQREWCKNRFQVTNQITVNARRVNRYDVTILINGLPLVQVELKRRGMQLKQAFNQINRYKSESYTGLFKYVQLYVISNGVDTKYIANDDRLLNYNFAFYWTDLLNNRINNLSDFTKDFLNPCHISKVISRYMILSMTDKKVLVMRPYQIYAVEKLVERATETRNNGYVWHATGSGKTLTSFKLSQILANLEDVKKVIFLVDRKDLDAQTLSEFNKWEKDCVDITSSTHNLTRQLEDPTKRLVITTIQKMNNALKRSRYAKYMEPFRDERVIFIIDECHRSQFGEMHKEIKKHFQNGQFFGFTGTPIFKENAGSGLATGNLFGKQMHHYMIKDGIKDHNVLGFKVDYIRTFHMGDHVTDDDVEDIDTSEVLEADQRVSNVVDRILKIHPIKTHNGEFNAIFTTFSIPMAMKYYRDFKNKDHDLKVATIFTYAPNDDLGRREELSRDALEEAIADYNGLFGTNFSTDSYDNYFSDISKRFKNKEIDILIVVDMFLTGYDSKLLNTLYVDKKLKMHNLIQAFSRTNRVHTDRKQFGNIVSFLTRKADVEEAVRIYSDSDSTDVVLLDPYEEYVRRAKMQVALLKSIAPDVQHVDTLESEMMQRDFIEAFKAVVRTVTTLKNFIEFEFTREEIDISEQEYMDYRSKYLDLNRHVSELNKVSILTDISFDIELLSTDTINVDYILRLLANINYENEIQKQVDLNKVKKVLEQNDTEELHSKIELLRRFIQRVIPTMTNDDNIEEKYEEYIKEEKETIIYDMSNNLDIEPMVLKEMISDFQFTNVMPNHLIRHHVKGKLLDKNQKMNQLREFIVEVSDLYE